jgi:4-amino-4-deoxy-L-arabinose transferase-like glycosyltransferase
VHQLALIAACATVLRIALAFVVNPGQALYSDMAGYDRVASHLLASAFHPADSLYAPGYPAMLALFYATVGRNFLAIGLVQALLGGATVLLVGVITLRLATARLAIAAALAAAVYPPTIYYGTLLLTEAVAPFVVTLAIWLLLLAMDAPSRRTVTAAGLAFGAAILIRSNLLMWVPMLACWFWLRARRGTAITSRTITIHAASLLVAIGLVVAGAMLRNSVALGRLAGTSTNGGVNFYMAQADVRGVADQFGSFVPVRNALEYSEMFESPVPRFDEQYFYGEGWAWFRQRPDKWRHLLHKIGEGFGLGRQGYWPANSGEAPRTWTSWLLAVSSSAYPWLLLFPATGFAAVRMGRNRVAGLFEPPVFLTVSFTALSIFTSAMFLADPRMHVPFDPVTIAVLFAMLRRVKPSS